MYISTEISSICKFTDVKTALKMLKDAGFTAFDFSMFDMIYWKDGKIFKNKENPVNKRNYKKYVKSIKEYSNSIGLVCNQAHAPFPTSNKIVAKLIKKSIKIASMLGAKLIVVHPFNKLDADYNIKYFKKLAKFAKKCKIIIGLENMWNWDESKDQAKKASCSHHLEFKQIINEINSPYVKACLDIGHASMKGLNTSVKDMILTLNKDLYALHIHDNDLHHDLHTLPFSKDIDFVEMVNYLKKINYQGDITLEADYYLPKIIKEKKLKEGVDDLANAAIKIYKMYNK